MTGGWGISREIALRWMPLDLTDDKSALVQVMAWCCQATNLYLNQCWPRFMSRYGVTRPQWVKERSFVSIFIYKWYLEVRSRVPYYEWWLSWHGLRALMIVSRLCYIVILKHDLLRVRHNDAIMSICICLDVWILNLEPVTIISPYCILNWNLF